MATRTREDRRLRDLSAVCLALPEAERTVCGPHADFRVHGKIFAYYLRSHGGDGITSVCCKARLGEHVEHVKRAPDRFYLPRLIGKRGWFGLRLDLGEINWDEVKALVTVSHSLAAPKALRATLAPLANALTAQSLVRGAPAPEPVGHAVAHLLDGNLLRGGRVAAIDEQRKPDLLRSTTVRETVSARGSGLGRSRR